jgi:nucleotide-binding universal stress UspA family protein
MGGRCFLYRHHEGDPMLKRILILLGETPSSAAAREYAFRLVQGTEAEVAGLSGVDLSFIEAPMPGRIGATAYKVRLEEQLKKQAEEARKRLHDVYEAECRDHSIPFEWLAFEGEPISTLYLATEGRDLVVTGHDTAFRGNIREQLSDTLATLLHLTPRPIVICPDELSKANDILIAYDGSVPAMRAVQMFALLGIGQRRRIQVASVDENQELAARRARGAADYLRVHGYQVEACPIVSRVPPAEVLKIEIADRNICTLVMGAYGHRGIREFLFGSTTNTLAENPPCALFMYH